MKHTNKEENTVSESREDQLFDRAEKIGYLLIPPTGERWLMADKTGGWLTFGSLDEVDEHLAAEEEGNDGVSDEEGDPGPPPLQGYRSSLPPGWAADT
jgi:hypothetical protein